MTAAAPGQTSERAAQDVRDRPDGALRPDSGQVPDAPDQAVKFLLLQWHASYPVSGEGGPVR